jgi:hypothetical protein
MACGKKLFLLQTSTRRIQLKINLLKYIHRCLSSKSESRNILLSEQTRKNHNKLGFSTFENSYRTLNSFNQDDNDDALQQLFNGIVSQERGSLARGITLIESAHPKKKRRAKTLLNNVVQYCTEKEKSDNMKPLSFRIGIA